MTAGVSREGSAGRIGEIMAGTVGCGRRGIAVWAGLLAVVLPAVAWSGPTGATTQPAAAGLPDARQLAPLIKMCEKLNQRRWGAPFVETFDKPPAKGVWQCEGGKLLFKDGRLIAETAQQGGMMSVWRTLPPAAAKGDGIRIDAWLEAEPMVVRGAARNVAFMYIAMGLSTQNLHPMQGDYSYIFAMSRNGVMQQFQCPHFGIHRSAGAAELKPGKLMHVKMELFGQQYNCQRDSNAALTERNPLMPPVRLHDKAMISFFGQSQQLRLVQIGYRVLEATSGPGDMTQEWAKTPFANQDALTQFLLEQVVPRLDEAKFQPRQQAADLLTSLWPLSKPAVERAAKGGGAGPDALLRLQSLTDYSPLIVAVTTRPDEEEIKPPVVKPWVPATQPADGKDPADPDNGKLLDPPGR